MKLRSPLLVFLLCLAPALLAEAPSPAAPPPSRSQQELQAPLNLQDEKPTPGQGTVPEASGLRALGSLALVLALVGGGLYALKRWGRGKLPGGGGGRLRIQESLALGERRYVSILVVDGERFLIATHTGGINLLTRLDAEEAPFDQALAQQVELNRPVALREMEAMVRRQEGKEGNPS